MNPDRARAVREPDSLVLWARLRYISAASKVPSVGRILAGAGLMNS